MTLGIAVAMAVSLAALTLPGVVEARGERAAARQPAAIQGAEAATFRYSEADDSVGNRLFVRIVIAASPQAPAPPGLRAAPQTGETWVSPAVLRLAKTDTRFAERIGRTTGIIADAGLQGPDEILVYSGVAASSLTEGTPAARYGGPVSAVSDVQSATGLAGALVLLIGAPALLFLGVCGRLSAVTRERRFASLNLVGMSRAQLVSLAGWEAAVVGGAASFLGIILFFAVNPILASSLSGFRWFPADSHPSVILLVVLSTAVAVASYWLGRAGLSRVLAASLSSRREGREASTSPLRVIPFFAGISVLITYLVLSAYQAYASTKATNVVVAATLVASLGLILMLRPAATGLAGAVLRVRPSSTSWRLGARRIQQQSSSLVRLVTGLVILILVACLGSAFMQDAFLASGADARQQVVEVSAFDVPAGRARDVAAALPAQNRVVQIRSDVAARDSGAPGSTDFANTFGVDVFFLNCGRLRQLAPDYSGACVNGNSYRLIDGTPGTAPSQVIPGTGLQITSDDRSVSSIVVPSSDIMVPGLLGNPLLNADSLLIATDGAPPGGWPEQTVFRYQIATRGSQLETLQTALAALAPQAPLRRATVNLRAVENYSVQRAVIGAGIAGGTLLAILAFCVAAIDRSFEQRRAVVSLVVLGAPVRLLRAAQLVQFVLPLTVALGAAVLTGHLAANAYLRSGGLQQGSFTPSLTLGLIAAAVGVLAAAAAALFVPGRRPRADELKRE